MYKFAGVMVFFMAASLLVAQEGSEEAWTGVGILPEQLRLPRRGEAPRYPRDLVIGELGRGAAPQEAYTYAQSLLTGLLSGNASSALLAGTVGQPMEEIFNKLKPMSPQKYRLGGGREEPDGSISFLFRFLGREESMAGELYIRLADQAWHLEDILLEDQRPLTEGDPSYPYDFSPYERFF